MTHKELINIGAKWLFNNRDSHFKCPFIVTELTSYCLETPDVFGIRYAGNILIEVKVSRNDFKADSKKLHRQDDILGIGAYRYYLCIEGIINIEELPAKWGLLYYNQNKKISIQKKSELFRQRNTIGEQQILQSVLRRIIGRPAILDFKKHKTGVE